MDLNEFKSVIGAKVRELPAPEPKPEEFDEPDLDDGINLLKRVKTYLDFLADPVLSRAVRNMTERNTIIRLSEEISEFLLNLGEL